MKGRIIIVGFVAMALFALCLTASLAIDNKNFRLGGSGEGILTRTPLSEQCWAVRIDGTGHVSHLGRVSVVVTYENVCLAPSGDNLLPSGPAGQGVITTASGDQIFGTFRWIASPTPTPGLLAIAGTFTITGGTGKYEGATGSGVYVATGNVPTNEVKTRIEGVISVAKK